MVTNGHEEIPIGLKNLETETVVQQGAVKISGLPQGPGMTVNMRNLNLIRETAQEQLPILRFPPIWFPISNVGIAGVECTQATQFFDFNGEGSGAGTDNSVPLVAGKATMLRVYPDRFNWLWAPAPTSLTGIVSYAQIGGSSFPNLSPINGPIPAMPASSIDRGNVNATLNFLIPAANCNGQLQVSVTLFDPAHPGDPAYSSGPLTFYSTFQVVPRVRVHGVLIHYTGRGMNIAAPSGMDLINTLAYVGKTYPTSGFNYTACEVIDFNGDLTVGGGGGCGTGWNQLFSTLWNMRASSGTNDVFVGLLPSGVPTSGVIGCGGGGVAIAYVNGGSVLAQEIGHAFGRAHAPCGNPGSPDPNYPTYNSYPSGSIGEYGFDTETSQVFSPWSTYDFMSYCGPTWISPYTYEGLMNGITSSMASAHPERAADRVIARENLLLSFRVYLDGRVELLSSFHLKGPAPSSEMGPLLPISCQLLSADGKVTLVHHCHFNDPHQDPEGPYMELHEVIPWEPDTKSIAFIHNGKVIDTYELEEQAPEVSIVSTARAEKRADLMRVEWQGKHPEKAVTYLLRYSNNGGTSWRAMAADLTQTSYVVNMELLPGGHQCKFQVVASAGVRTTLAETEPFAVAQKPRQAYILLPEAGASFTEGQAVILRGAGFSPDFETSLPEDGVWTSDIDGILGVGYELVLRTLSVGEHTITLRVADGLGGEASSHVTITVQSGA